MSFLIDTMVLCEPTKARPNPGALAWLAAQPVSAIAVSVISLGEVAYGLLRLDDGPRKARLQDWLARDILAAFGGRMLSVDAKVAAVWAQLRSRAGRTLPVADGLVAATALAHDLTLVSRNARDFEGLGLRLINPFQP